jgi:phthiocerol/phenolphthiocerol synthesis type-I polyketide synthase E
MLSKPPDPHGIAIIGVGLRFPGASTVDTFWRNLRDGRESVRFFSNEELLDNSIPEDLLGDPAYVKASPVLDGFDLFDESFFGYSPKEAVVMDPQNRLLLEVSWETFEDAGYSPAALHDSGVGVFIGGGSSLTSYLLAFAGHPDMQGQTAGLEHVANDRDFLATRVSYKLNLTGPSLTVQTACSTSVVAVHLACQSILSGESDLALAGASVVRVPHISGYRAVRGSVHSSDGHCRPFDASGTGTIFGSGVATVLLKPLTAALRDRDHIYSVIKGSAITNDGSGKVSYTAPSATGQARAIIEALTVADVPADTLSYVECHATGTPGGDPVEIQALTRAFRVHTKANGFCSIGSVKGNIGHAEQAAGMGGLIKTALALHNGAVPPTIGFAKLSSQLSLPETPFYIQTALTPWPEERNPRRAGVNSLGIGGTNAFVVMEEAPAVPWVGDNEPTPHLFAISAKTASALSRYAEKFVRFLHEKPQTDVDSLCFTSCASRSGFEHRFAAVVNNTSELVHALQRTGLESPSERPPIVFLFSGQGSQYSGMGLELYKNIPEFRRHFDACDAISEPLLGRSLKELVFRPDCADLNQTRWTQPGLFALEYSIAEVWRAWGVFPTAVMGHSLGEIAAACFSGMLSLQDAFEFVITRAALMQSTASNGGMEAFLTDRATVEAALTGLEDRVGVAAVNTPANTVLSGEHDALAIVRGRLAAQGVASKCLAVSHAFHSPLVDRILPEIESAASRMKVRPPQCTLVSNVTGEIINAAPAAMYWRDHVRKPVRFADGLRTLAASASSRFIEIGPGSTVLSFTRECLAPSRPWMHASLLRREGELRSMLDTAAALYTAGIDLRWSALYEGSGGRRISLPTYPFERNRHWLTPARACTRSREPGLYTVRWKHSPLHARVSCPGGVVIVGDDSSSLKKALAVQWRVLSATAESLRQVLAEHATDRLHILYLAGSTSITDASSIDEFIAIEEAHTHSALAVTKAVLEAQSSGDSRLWFITRGAQSIHGASADPLQAVLWGMGRSLHLEAPRHWGGLIDISPETCPEEGARNIAAAISDSTTQQHLFVCGNHYTPQLVPSCCSHSDPLLVRGDRTYLVTGGLGVIGRLTSRWLLEKKDAGCVVLVSRHASAAVPADLAQFGKRVRVIAADISSECGVVSVLNKISRESPPLAGIFHGAGVLADGIAAQMTPEQFTAATAPKIRGAWLLHRHTVHLPLDFFIVHSSLLSVTGSAGQCNYTAANAFLDAFVQYRRTIHLPGMAINWGPWAEAGMAVSMGARADAHWRRLGIYPIQPATGAYIINRLFESPPVNVAVVDCDWALYARSALQNRSMIERLVPADNPCASVPHPDLRAELAEGDWTRRESLVTETVCTRVSVELGVAGPIDMNRRLDDLGVDSLMAVNLANSIESALGLPIAVSQVMGSATVRDLVASVLAGIRSDSRTKSVNRASAWIVTPVPRPKAQFRLFCFHYAGASASVYRAWADLLSPAIELCAIDPPGRGARLSEPSVTSLRALLDGILPEMEPLLDRPYALMGHCLGALNLFEAGRLLMRSNQPPVHAFVSGCRPPHRLLTHGTFEESLLRTLLGDEGFDPTKPYHKQPDHTFATLIRHFNIGATDDFLAHSDLRDILLPAIRADFEIVSRYRFTPEPPWDVPLTCFIGLDDPYVTREDAVGWNRYTCRDFRIHFRPGNHFLIVDNRDFIVSIINTTLADSERKVCA